jgi:inorganic pyrophosphatase
MIKVLIQVDGGSSERRIYNERTLEYRETRQVSQPYPYPYGFILGTRSEDGDSVDCYVITRESLQAGSIVECEPIGLLEQNEDGEIDHKVLASQPNQKAELNQELLYELRSFIYAIFSKYPDMHITVGNILPREEALRHIEEFHERE